MVKVVVIGANGQLGSELCSVSSDWELIELTHQEIEITDPDSAKQCLDISKPDVVINAAAFANVPKCEEEPLKAFHINAIGTKNLAQWCAHHKCVLAYISTDYVFDGSKSEPYLESDSPNPLNAYGVTKLAGEHFVKANSEKYFIIRTTGLYGRNPCRSKAGDNFVKIALRLASKGHPVKMRGTEICTPTSAKNLAQQIVELLKSNAFGVYHATNEGECSWFQFAQAIYDFCHIKTPLISADTDENASTLKRPRYSVLENKKLKDLGINRMAHWREALREYLTESSLI